jgi:transcriptional regulator with XRE-family HTH domain
MDSLGMKLRRLRKKERWTLEDVANRLGLKGHSTYSNWEYDRREPDIETIKMLANLYNVPVVFLVGEDTQQENKEGETDEQKLIRESKERMKKAIDDRNITSAEAAKILEEYHSRVIKE